MSKVVITGVSGSLGTYLAANLLGRGYEVVGISRTNPEIAGVRHVSQDLTKPSGIRFDSDWTVVNCAAVTRDGWSRELESQNLEITRNALALGGGAFVQVSSSSVYNLCKPSMVVTEDEAPGEYEFLNSYSRSKFETEKLVAVSAAVPFLILRPHALIGPTDNTLGPRVQRAIRNGKLRLPGAGEASHEFTSFENFSHAVELAIQSLEVGVVSNHTINVSNGVSTTISQAIKDGLAPDSPRIVGVPVWLAWALAAVVERFASDGSEPRLSRYQVAQLAFDRSYDLTAARELLGYSPNNSVWSHLPESNW